MSKQLILLSIIFGSLLISGPTFAQKGKLKKAYSLVEALDYQSAVDILLPMADNGDDVEVATLLGNIFRKQNSYSRAAVWYEKAVSLPGVEPSTYFYYGMVLLHINKCREAQQQFDYFLSLKPLDPRQFQLKESCTYRQQLLSKQQDQLDVEALNFNSVFSDIGPAFYRDGLVFGSVRAPQKSAPNQIVNPFYDLYYARMTDGHFKFDEPESFSSRINSRVHEAIVTFSPDGSMIYFTRNQGTDNEHSSARATGLEIVYAVSEDGNRWGELQLMPFNSPKYSIAHPALSDDGKRLFFSSDMPGGFGGKDIYLTEWKDEHWNTPVNLGPLVNTEGDEMFPFYHASGKLYFSSDGQVGLGGQDIFTTEPNIAGVWANIENVGGPINTEWDDYGIIVSKDDSYGYFTSNRPGGIGKDDIYGFQPIGLAQEEEPEEIVAEVPRADQNKVVIHIQVIDAATGERIENPEIHNCEVNLYRSVGTSSFQMNLYPGDCCEVAVMADGYEESKMEVCGDPDNRSRAIVLRRIGSAPATAPAPVVTKTEPVKEEQPNNPEPNTKTIPEAPSETPVSAAVKTETPPAVKPEPKVIPQPPKVVPVDPVLADEKPTSTELEKVTPPKPKVIPPTPKEVPVDLVLADEKPAFTELEKVIPPKPKVIPPTPKEIPVDPRIADEKPAFTELEKVVPPKPKVIPQVPREVPVDPVIADQKPVFTDLRKIVPPKPQPTKEKPAEVVAKNEPVKSAPAAPVKPQETPAETTLKAEEPMAEAQVTAKRADRPATVGETSISVSEEKIVSEPAKRPATPPEEKAITVSNEAGEEIEETVESVPSNGVIEETTEIVRQTTRARKVTKYLIGTVYDPLNSRPIPFATIHLLNSTCGVNVKIQSDQSGHYRLPLIADCCINVRVEKEGFQTYTALEALCTDKNGNVKGSTSILLKPDPKPQPKKINAETTMLLNRGAFEGFERSKNTKHGDNSLAFILNVYYETGRTSVKEESVADLKKLLKLLEENPTLIVEIGAHTDSRGSDTYNNDLSQRRAENVVKYLVSQGINTKRLIPKGYGESQLINDCTDEKECSEDEHQINRRTEFRVLGSLEQTE